MSRFLRVSSESFSHTRFLSFDGPNASSPSDEYARPSSVYSLSLVWAVMQAAVRSTILLPSISVRPVALWNSPSAIAACPGSQSKEDSLSTGTIDPSGFMAPMFLPKMDWAISIHCAEKLSI